ncbi:putative glutathione peroxidase [Chromobacterium vaccinii]|nr:putative glutathione peroxidase [Chromobacterium vaccinii]
MNIYDFTFRRLDGGEQAMADYRGRVLLLVNTASRCGFTPSTPAWRHCTAASASRDSR